MSEKAIPTYDGDFPFNWSEGPRVVRLMGENSREIYMIIESDFVTFLRPAQRGRFGTILHYPSGIYNDDLFGQEGQHFPNWIMP